MKEVGSFAGAINKVLVLGQTKTRAAEMAQINK
jgi:hypothetical protein